MKFNVPQPPILVAYYSISVGGLICLPNLAQAQIQSQIPRSKMPFTVSAKPRTQPARIPTLNLMEASTAKPRTQPARIPTLNLMEASTVLLEDATLPIFPDRASVINFRTGEFITSVTLSDSTYVLYTPNAEIASGQTTALILRLSNVIPFENLSRSSTLNIKITTVNSDHQQLTYLFGLEIASGRPRVDRRDYNSIAIVPYDEAIVIRDNRIQTSKGDATMNDVEHGLKIASRRGSTTRTDLIVNRVREVLAQARNGGSLGAIAPQVGVPLSLLSALGALGLEASKGRR